MVHTQNQAKTRIALLWLVAPVCLFITGCSDESAQHCNLGISYWKNHEYDKAIKEFGMALKINPKKAKAYYFRANTFYDSGQYSRAWDDVRAAEDLGYRVNASFLKILREVTGRNR